MISVWFTGWSRFAKAATLGGCGGVVLLAVALLFPPGGLAAVAWSVRGAAQPSLFIPAAGNRYQLIVSNTGSEPTSGAVTLIDDLPQGLTLANVTSDEGPEGAQWGCSETQQSVVACSLGEVLRQGGYAPSLAIEVSAPSEGPVALTNTVSVSGGGAVLPAFTSQTTGVGTGQQSFAITEFMMEAHTATGEPDQRAGGHPWQVTASFAFPWVRTPPQATTQFVPVANVKKLAVELPAGMVGNLQTTQRCGQVALFNSTCPPGSRIGTLAVAAGKFESADYQTTSGGNASAVYNMESQPGYPVVLGLTFAHQTVLLYATLVHSASGERVRLTTVGIPSVLETGDIMLTLWGEPGVYNESGSTAGIIANPVNCSAAPTNARMEVETWANPGHTLSAETTIFKRLTGCGQLGEAFRPALLLSPLEGLEGTTQADAPSGYSGTLRIPQDNGAFQETQTPEAREATVSLPAGLAINPAAGEGLVGCSERGPDGINLSTGQNGVWGADEGNPEATELGAGHAGGNSSTYDDGEYHTAPGHCPPASTVGSVEVFTPLLEDRCGGPGQARCKEGESPAPLQGDVYIAQPKCGGHGQPPCTGPDAENGNLYAAYVEVSGDGVLVKQPATLSASQSTGQLTLHVREMPALPFSELKVRVHGGPRAPLANSLTCGLQTTTSAFAPWSGGPEATPASSLFGVDWDGIGGACPASNSFSPWFTAGAVTPAAGQFSPFALTLTREDREQNLSDLVVTLPAGVLARIAGVEKCPDRLAGAGQCPGGSKIATLTVAAGSGPNPLYVHGDVYLTDPYKGAPFGESAVIHAQAGPFNLGDVVVRGAIRIDSTTAQATIVSDPFPQIIDGVPARVRAVNVSIDRPRFTFNPTDCSQLHLQGTVSALQGAVVNTSVPFAAVNCAVLPFKPVFSATTGGHASKQGGASLDVKVWGHGGPQPGGGEANISKVKVSLPKIMPTRLETLHKACLAAVFEANPASCPSVASVGVATVSTSILANPLSGPAILVSHGGQAFPDLDIVLQGEGVTLILVGHTDITNGVTTSTFNSVPDAPISSFELKLPTGRFSILGAYASGANHYNLCGHTLNMPTTITAQNGAVLTQTTKIAATGCPKAKKATWARKLAAALRSCHRKPRPGARALCARAARRRYAQPRK